MLNIAIIGCGYMANDVHMPCILKYINEHNSVKVVACSDIIEEKAKKFAEKYSIDRYFTDYNEMFRTLKPDIAVCLVSENVIADTAVDTLNAGVHALIEKPPGKTVNEIMNIINTAKTHEKLKTMVAFNRRFAPVYIKLKDLCQNKKIRHIKYEMYRINRHESYFETTAIHAIDTVRWLAGSDFSKVRIEYQDMPEKGNKVANYYIYGEFGNEITAQISCMVSTGKLYEGCQILCDDSIYYADFISDGDNYGIKEYADNKLVNIITADTLCSNNYIDRMGFYNEHKVFYDSVIENKSIAAVPSTVVQSVEICDAIKNRFTLL